VSMAESGADGMTVSGRAVAKTSFAGKI